MSPKKYLLLMLFILITTFSYATERKVNPEMAIRIFKIYSANYDKAFLANDYVGMKVAFENIKRYSKKLKKIQSLPRLKRVHIQTIRKYLNYVTKMEKQLAAFSSKKIIPKPKYEASVDYNTTVGTFFGAKVDWFPEQLSGNELHNVSSIRLADKRMDNMTLRLDNKYKYNKMPIQTNVAIYSDGKNKNNNNTQIDGSIVSNVDLYWEKQALLKSDVQLRFQKSNNNGRFAFYTDKEASDNKYSNSYVLNLSESKKSSYHKLSTGYANSSMSLWGYDFQTQNSGHLSHFPNNSIATSLYLSSNNSFKGDSTNLNTRFILNHMPDNKNSSYFSINNKYGMQNVFGLKRSSAKYDIKFSSNKASRYYRVGTGVALNPTQRPGFKLDPSLGIDFYEYELSASKYNTLYMQANVIDSGSGALLSNYYSRLGRRTYPNANNSAWSLDMSTTDQYTFFGDWDVTGVYNASIVRFDKSSKIQSDTLSLSSGFTQSHRLNKDSLLNTNYNLSWMHFFNDPSQTNTVLTISSIAQF